IVAAATSAFVGAFVNPVLLLVAACLAAAGVIGAVWPLLTIRGIECEVKFDRRRTRCGRPVDATLRVKNRWPWPLWGLALRKGYADAADTEPVAALGRVPAWSSAEFSWQFTPSRRGVFPVTTPEVESAFPFGVWTAKRTIESGRLIVWPESHPLRNVPEVAAADSHDETLSDRRAGEFGDLLGVRRFREGDSLRRVHWAQTARHGRLISTERQAGAVAVIRVVADLSADSFRGRPEDLEAAIEVVASLCEFLPREHAQVECVLGDRVLSVSATGNGLRDVLDRLASIPPDGQDAPPKLSRGPAGVMTLLVTAAGSPAATRQSGVRVIAVGAEET
ncbi:MAG: DUF58 domain-containing protein, partial [Planctomycetota bacterium]